MNNYKCSCGAELSDRRYTHHGGMCQKCESDLSKNYSDYYAKSVTCKHGNYIGGDSYCEKCLGSNSIKNNNNGCVIVIFFIISTSLFCLYLVSQISTIAQQAFCKIAG
jgi:hypothetical protein